MPLAYSIVYSHGARFLVDWLSDRVLTQRGSMERIDFQADEKLYVRFVAHLWCVLTKSTIGFGGTSMGERAIRWREIGERSQS